MPALRRGPWPSAPWESEEEGSYNDFMKGLQMDFIIVTNNRKCKGISYLISLNLYLLYSGAYPLLLTAEKNTKQTATTQTQRFFCCLWRRVGEKAFLVSGCKSGSSLRGWGVAAGRHCSSELGPVFAAAYAHLSAVWWNCKEIMQELAWERTERGFLTWESSTSCVMRHEKDCDAKELL